MASPAPIEGHARDRAAPRALRHDAPLSEVLGALAALASRDPEREAVLELALDGAPARRATRAELLDHVLDVAGAIEERTSHGEAVVLCLANGVDFVAAFLGVLAAGRTVVPVPHRSGLPEARRVAAAVGARLVIDDPAHEVMKCRAREPSGREAAAWCGAILQSSGTTGLPRLVRRSRCSLFTLGAAIHAAVGLREDDRVLAAVPMPHSYGMESGLLAPLSAGATIVALPGLDAGSLERALAAGVTVLPGVPFFYEALASRSPRHSLRIAYSAGSDLPRRVRADFESAWRAPIGQLYGASELGTLTYGHPDTSDLDPASVGVALPGVDILIAPPGDDSGRSSVPPGTEGQVLARSPWMLELSTDEASSGSIATGDLGRLDSRGRLFITGRTKLIIEVGGAKVNPLEVERAVCEHPSVAECAVVPMRVSATVSRLRALITTRPGAPAPTESELRSFVRDRLPSFKVPRTFELRESLPKTATGKLMRQALAESTR